MRSRSPDRKIQMSDIKRILWGDDVRRATTVMAALFLVACIVYLLVVYFAGIETEVIRDRFWKNAEPLFNGEFPVMEYPPLAIVFIAIPRFFGNTPWSYETAYVAEVFVFVVIGLLLVSRLARVLGYDRIKAMMAYSILVVLMIEFVLDRFDIFVMVIALASVLMFAERRYNWAFVLLAVGVLVKLYPAILFPVYVLLMMNQGRMREMAVGAASFVTVGLVAVAVCWVINPEIITNFLSYNSGRPLQIESVAASVIYFFSLFGVSDMWIQEASAESFWSDNLRGAIPDAVSEVLLACTVIGLIAVWVLSAYLLKRHPGQGSRLAALAMLACMLVFLVVNKVFSSQYVIWLIGPVLLVMLVCNDGFGRRVFMLTVAIILLTQLNFAYNIGYLGGGDAINSLGMAILLVRNILTVYMLAVVLRRMFSVGDGDADGQGSDAVLA